MYHCKSKTLPENGGCRRKLQERYKSYAQEQYMILSIRIYRWPWVGRFYRSVTDQSCSSMGVTLWDLLGKSKPRT